MALPENRQKIKAIMDLLSPQIIGKEHQESRKQGVAVEIVPGGNVYHGQEVDPLMWSVRIKPQSNANSYYIFLRDILSEREIIRIFKLFFQVRSYTPFHNPYMLKDIGLDRVLADYPPAIAIADCPDEAVLVIEWGNLQLTANTISDLYLCGQVNFDRGGEMYSMLLRLIEGRLCRSSNIYLGGLPVSMYDYEPRWRVDLEKILTEFKSEAYAYSQITRVGSTYHKGNFVFTHSTIRFVKNR